MLEKNYGMIIGIAAMVIAMACGMNRWASVGVGVLVGAFAIPFIHKWVVDRERKIQAERFYEQLKQEERYQSFEEPLPRLNKRGGKLDKQEESHESEE